MNADDNNKRPMEDRSRRGFLRNLGLGALGVTAGAALGATQDASAGVDGDVVLGGTNTTAAETVINVGGTNSLGSGLKVNVSDPQADFGIRGDSLSTGVLGNGAGYGVIGLGGASGGYFSGLEVSVSLGPLDDPGPPTADSLKGDLAVDSDGVLWICVLDGVGHWIKVSHGGTRYLSAPFRAYDSRLSGGKLGIGSGGTGTQGNPRVIPITGVVPGLPTNAVGVIGNLTVTQEDGSGNATIWPGGAFPGTSSVNYLANFDIANSFSVGLSGTGTVSVASFATTHVIIDIAGYVL
jgi:hypothetical protein